MPPLRSLVGDRPETTPRGQAQRLPLTEGDACREGQDDHRAHDRRGPLESWRQPAMEHGAREREHLLPRERCEERADHERRAAGEIGRHLRQRDRERHEVDDRRRVEHREPEKQKERIAGPGPAGFALERLRRSKQPADRDHREGHRRDDPSRRQDRSEESGRRGAEEHGDRREDEIGRRRPGTRGRGSAKTAAHTSPQDQHGDRPYRDRDRVGGRNAEEERLCHYTLVLWKRLAFISKRGNVPGATASTAQRMPSSRWIAPARRSAASAEPSTTHRSSSISRTRASSTRYSPTSSNLRMIASIALGKTLTPRTVIMSSTRPAIPPASFTRVRPHEHVSRTALTRSPVR